MALRARTVLQTARSAMTCLLGELNRPPLSLCTTNLKNPLDSGGIWLSCQLCQRVGVGIACGDEGRNDDASVFGQEVPVCAVDLPDQTMRAPRFDRNASTAFLLCG